MPVAALGQRADDPRIICTVAKRTAKPRARINARDMPNGGLCLFQVVRKTAVSQIRKRRMEMGMATDQVPGRGH